MSVLEKAEYQTTYLVSSQEFFFLISGAGRTFFFGEGESPSGNLNIAALSSKNVKNIFLNGKYIINI